MAYEDHVIEGRLAADGQDIFGVRTERAVMVGVVGAQVRPACPDVVGAEHPELILEAWGDMTPHVLVTAGTVGEHHELTRLVGRTSSR
jgi:hypothetical protein